MMLGGGRFGLLVLVGVKGSRLEGGAALVKVEPRGSGLRLAAHG